MVSLNYLINTQKNIAELKQNYSQRVDLGLRSDSASFYSIFDMIKFSTKSLSSEFTR